MRTVARLSPIALALVAALAVYLTQSDGGKRAFYPAEVVRRVTVAVAVTATPDPAGVVVIPVTPTPAPTVPNPTPTPVVNRGRVLEQYAGEQYRALEEMPPELFHAYSSTLDEVALFFGVRPDDLLRTLQSQNEEWLVLSSARPEGIAGIPVAAWNGWAYPFQEEYLTDVRLIAQHGGLGFDWRQRTLWQYWVEQNADSSNLNGAIAEPGDLTDSMATLANFLARSGVTAAAAAQDEAGAETRLNGALAALRAGDFHTLPPLAAEGQTAFASEPLRAAFNRRLDETWGAQFSEAELEQSVDRSPVAARVASGALSAEEGAAELVAQVTEYSIAENRQRAAEGRALIWPFASDDLTLRTQLFAVQALGHTLTPWEARDILESASNDRLTAESRISARADARLYSAARARYDEGLERSAQGFPISTREVAHLVHPILAHHTIERVSSSTLQEAIDGIEYQIRALPEFQARHGKLFFSANPLNPWPQSIGQPFGSPADYQPGGRHTGIDVRGTRDGGNSPLLFAVEDGVVAHMGALFCLGANVCRGPYAIVLDHGSNVYSIYSHNSEAFVQTGDTVTAGQAIGRQGSEGYSRGSHLHFEVHVGAPYTGAWTEPFRGGEFINPLPWLPRSLRSD